MPTMMMMMMVMMVMMMVVVDTSTVHVSSRRSHSDTCNCDSRKSGDEFDLVHCRVPFIFAQAHSCAYTELGLIS